MIEEIIEIVSGMLDDSRKITAKLERLKAALIADPTIDVSMTDAVLSEYEKSLPEESER